MRNIERHKWIIVGGLFVINMIMFGALLNFGVFFEPLRATFLWSHERTSSLITALILTSTVANPIVGAALQRIEAQTSMLIGVVLQIASYVIASQAHDYNLILIAYGLMGVAIAMSTLVPAQLVVANWFDVNSQGAAFGIAAAGAGFGGLVMVLGADAAVRWWGWRTAFLVSSVSVAVIAIPVILLLVRTRPPTASMQRQSISMAPGMNVAQGFRDRSFWLIMVAYACYGFAVGMPVAHFIPFLIKIGATPHSAAMVIVEYEAVGTTASLLMGFFGDRVGGKLALVVCLALLAISYWLILHADTLSFRILFVISFGFGVTAPTGLLALLLVHTLGLKSFSFFSGIGQFVLFLAAAVAPFFGGWIVDVAANGYRDAFLLCAVFAIIGALATVAVQIPRRSVATFASQVEPIGAGL